jgi:hypothetical protein
MKQKFTIALILAMAVASIGATLTRDNTARIGDSAGGTAKTLKLGPLGEVSWSGSKMQFSNDGGLNNTDIGGGVGGAAGINILATKNADMERVTGGKPSDWTESAGVLATEATNVHDGAAAASWDAAAASDTLVSDAVNIDANEFGGLNGENCTLIAYYLATTISEGDVKMEAVDGSSNVLNTVDLKPTQANKWTKAQITFPCPFGTTLKAEFEATTNADAVLIDSVFLGRFDLIDVSQAKHMAHAYFAETANCRWQRTNTALGDFGVDADCPAITVVSSEVSVDATDTDLPQIVFPNLPSGKYDVSACMTLGNSGASNANGIAISDGTDTRGVQGVTVDAAVPNHRPQVCSVAHFVYTSRGARTFKAQGAATAGTLSLINDISETQLTFNVVRYPDEKSQAVKLDQALRWGAAQWAGHSSHSETSATFQPVSETDFSDNVIYLGGAVAIGGSEDDLAFQINNVPAGEYEVIFSGTMRTEGVSTDCRWQIYDGTNALSAIVHETTAAEARLVGAGLHGVVKYTTFQASKTFTVRSRRVSGSGNCRSIALAASDGPWSLIFKPIGVDVPGLNLIGVESSARYTGGNGTGSTATRIARWDAVSVVGTGLTAGQDATNGDIATVNSAGLYAITYCRNQSSGGRVFAVIKNHSDGTINPGSRTSAEVRCINTGGAVANTSTCCSITERYAVGDTIAANPDEAANGTGDALDLLSIVKVSN